MSEEVIKSFIVEIDRVLIGSGHLLLWMDKYHLCTGVMPWLEGTSLATVDMIVWNKMRIGMGYRTRRTSEYCLVLQKKPLRAKGVWKAHMTFLMSGAKNCRTEAAMRNLLGCNRG